jgi:hypothetical protein
MIHRNVAGYDKGMENASLFPYRGKDMLRECFNQLNYGFSFIAFNPRLQISLASSA